MLRPDPFISSFLLEPFIASMIFFIPLLSEVSMQIQAAHATVFPKPRAELVQSVLGIFLLVFLKNTSFYRLY